MVAMSPLFPVFREVMILTLSPGASAIPLALMKLLFPRLSSLVCLVVTGVC